MSATPVTACRACGGTLGAVFCDLGVQPVANSYVAPARAAEREPAFPLRAVVCDACRLVQLDTVVDAEGIFSDYAYFSSASSSWLDHAARFSREMTRRLDLGSRSFVVEVASNDGYLLRNFVAAGIPCLGVEPAANVAEVARAAGVPTEARFFGEAYARDLVARRGHADLIAANNVLAHVPGVNEFVAGLAVLAGPRGTVSIEAPHLLRMVDGVQFDTIYHEHYAYWSLLAMERLLARHGLHVFEVERLATHGGSLRVLAGTARREPGRGLLEVRAEEAARGLDAAGFYAGFQARVQAVLGDFRAWLWQARAAGRRIGAYGAAAKGNTFLNAVGATAGDIVAVADRSPAKQGRLLPGSRIPVVTPEALLALPLDDILVLPWNIGAEIAAQLRRDGFRGRILTAVPAMRELAG
ncbi:class I SAM-dependent methyltransferase [Falsiroseomonas oryzae]|uniref:class I SAM-dependent methyltransferase n=1 Tax=Falsiroseomonas oryzae TaxID=2766473 RepID=UPI0022EB589D|nr:class I SAM-dependent methyltransferase [Roseomonas sp. MO-31]